MSSLARKLTIILFIILVIPSVVVSAQENKEYTYYFPLMAKDDPRILVYLPENYYNTTKNYPVLYMNDGELIYGKFKADFIVVCIQNTDKKIARWNYLSPWVQYDMPNWWPNSPQELGGDGEDYLTYILKTKEWIDRDFRTFSNRENTAIGGFSMGGFFSVYAGLKEPDIFSRVISFSPAVWFGARNNIYWLTQNNLIDFVEVTGNPENIKFFWYVGGNEYHAAGYPIEGGNYPTIYKQGTNKLYSLLGGKYIYNPLGKHNPTVWLTYFDTAFAWLGW